MPESSRPGPEPNPGPSPVPETDPINASTVHTALAEVLPEDAIVVLESPSATLALRNQLRLSRPGSYYFSAGGGLGFGLAGLGRGAAGRSPTGRSSACSARARPSTRSPPSGAPSPTSVPVTFLVLRNEEYAILKWFAEVEQVSGAPGLDLPKLDVAAVAEGYGVKAHRASDRDAVRGALAAALASSAPELVEVPVAPGMSLF